MRYHMSISVLMALFLAFALSVQAAEIIPDANTVILDHFNGSTIGTAYGTLNYQTSLPGMGEAAVFGPGNFVQYVFTPWYQGLGSNPATQGTIEAWVLFQTAGSFLDLNWGNSTVHPGSGHVLYSVGNTWPDGAFGYSTWNWERGSRVAGMWGSTEIPTGEWLHLALSWGPSVSKIYVNGVVAATVNDNVYPAFNGSTNWAYLNEWGDAGFSGLIDEFYMSSVQRTDAQIAADAGVPEPGTLSLLALGALLIGLRRSRRTAQTTH